MTQQVDLNFPRRNCKFADPKKQTRYGMKRKNFNDRTGHVCDNGWTVTGHAGVWNGNTLWFSACSKCGVSHRGANGEPSKLEFTTIKRRKGCACGAVEVKGDG